MNRERIRNIAIIAHVDHGKTTLVDALLKQSNTFRSNQAEMSQTLIMDSMDQEHERGITITAKQTAVFYDGYKINIIDTPGHADFSGEVERTLGMADGVLLIVDAQEGPMPQTKFVLQKALGLGLKPVVIINKIDKPAARIAEVESEVADLFLELATDEAQLNYPIYYAVARDGRAGASPELDADLHVIFEAIIHEIPAPVVDENEGKGAQLLVSALAADSYLGKYAIGKVHRGKFKKGENVKIVREITEVESEKSAEGYPSIVSQNGDFVKGVKGEGGTKLGENRADVKGISTGKSDGAGAQEKNSGANAGEKNGETRTDKTGSGTEASEKSENSAEKQVEVISAKIDKIFTYRGLGKEEATEAHAGDIVALTGLTAAGIGDTIATVPAGAGADYTPEALPTIQLEPPTLSIYIGPNTSPLKGQEGEFTTSRQIAERLEKELETNIALRITPDGLGYRVSGRGELHLSVLIETMRREGYELEAGRPEVVYKMIDGVRQEPVEELTVEVGAEYIGAVSSELGLRRAQMLTTEQTSAGTTRFTYRITTAALIGLRNNLLTATKGTVLMSSLPMGYQPVDAKYQPERNGALISFETGVSTAYALDAAQARGTLFIPPQVPVYQGMIVGLSNKKEDLDINVCREKQLTNMRTHASDGAIQLTPYTQLSLEQCLDFLLEDELLEVTPRSLRLRKRQLDPVRRKREGRS